MDDYLTKPFRLAELHAKLRPWLARAAGPAFAACAVAPAAPAAAAPDPCRIDESVLERLRAEQMPGRPDVASTVARMFVDRSGQLLEALREALRNGVAADARRHAHTLKSNCMHVGANGLAALAQRAEHAARDGDVAAAARLAQEIEPALAAVRARLRDRHPAPADACGMKTAYAA
jgi:HPt (histidine-containing phosphotransfer) domain-containing protein